MAQRRALRAALLATALSLVAGPAAAQNGFSFLDASRSTIDYRAAPSAPRVACAELRALSGGAMTVVVAQSVPASESTPAFCRVVGVIQPEIQFEVALPSAWNRRLYMRGNGGFAGESLEAPPRVAQRNRALQHGFVAAQTNTGHDAETEPLATFAPHLQKRIDYSFRAVHVTARAAKRLARAYYDRPVAFSYWDGCSTGGRQGLMSAQRFPADFDGIVAGAPVLNFTDTIVTALWNARALSEAPLTLDTLKIVADAVTAKCGGPDGVVDDPRRCAFDPARDLPLCAATSGAGCVTTAQAEALKKIYGGPVSNGKPFFPGQPIGAEKVGAPPFGEPQPMSGWDRWLIGRDGGKSLQLGFGESFARYMAFGKVDASYDWKTFDFDRDPARMGEIRRLLNATDPDLGAFR